MSAAINHTGLGRESLEAIYNSITPEALSWKDASEAVMSLKDKLAGAEYDRKDMVLRALFNVCAEGLQKIQITNSLPEKTIDERRDYRDALLKTVRAREQQTYDSALDVNLHISPLTTSILDYGEGPLNVYYTSQHILLDGVGAFDKDRRDSAINSTKYKVSVEKSREQRRRTIMRTHPRMPKGKIIGRGEKIDSFSTMQLESGLLEFYQPVMHGVGMGEDAAERMRGRVRSRLEALARKRRELRSEARLPRVLIESKDMINDLVSEIKPRSFYDMAVGHPLHHKIAEYALSNKFTKTRLEALEATRMQVFPGVQCPQYFLYDQLPDIVLGDPPSVLWMTSAYLEGWGYKPLPGFGKASAYDVIHPTKGLNVASILPRLEQYVNPAENRTPVV